MQPAVTPVQTKTFTVHELQIVMTVLNTDENKGHTIKDLRLAKNVTDRVKESIPAAPQMAHVAFADPKKPTPEEMEAFKQSQTKYNEDVQAYLDSPVDVALSDFEFGLLKTRVMNFGSFRNDPVLRDKIVTLADKLGI